MCVTDFGSFFLGDGDRAAVDGEGGADVAVVGGGVALEGDICSCCYCCSCWIKLTAEHRHIDLLLCPSIN